MKRISVVLCSMALGVMAVCAQDHFLPPTMGWSSWNTFGANISESIIKGQAKAMIDKGFAAVGYNYINIDDGYFANRDENGRLIIHPRRFPNGMKPVVDYIHSLGLKAGCYSDAGHNTCASKWGGETGGVGAGLYEHDAEDCEMYFNEFGFDFIKVDFCGGVNYHNVENLDLDPRERYTAIREAINATGRTDIVFNACRWDYPGIWISDIADSWRISGDINASWGSVKDIIHQSLYLAPYCGGGHYNDMDMLEVGRGLTADEDVTHFGMWCIMSSPLLIGCDMRNVSSRALKLMTNEELIALNQDPLGLQAYVAKKIDGAYILVKDIEERNSTTRAVAVYNPTDESVSVPLEFVYVDLGGEVAIRDLVKHNDLGTFIDSYLVELKPHASAFLKLKGEKRLIRTEYEAEEAFLPAYQELVNNSWAETAIYAENDICSNGAAVGWLGKSANNRLEWRNVYVDKAGEYDITIYFISGESRNMTVKANDGKGTKLSCNSGGWDRISSKTCRINLVEGYNTISLSNTSGWMPDVDCMSLAFVDAGVSSIVNDKAAADHRVIDLNGRVVSTDGSTESLPTGIYIKDGKKIHLPE